MKQTAMQMAIDHYKKLSEQGSNQAYIVAKFLEENFLAMEKEQMCKFAYKCHNRYKVNGDFKIEQYYDETFKSE